MPTIRFVSLACLAIATGCTNAPPSVETEADTGGTDAGTTSSPLDTDSSAGPSTSIDGTTTDDGTTDDGTTDDGTTTDGTTDDGTTGDPDDDRDGHPASADCDDTDPEVHPRAPERCNGIDDDCDPATPEDGVASVDGHGSFVTINAAVAAATPGAEVRVCAGTWLETVTIVQDLVLVAEEGAAFTTIDGGGAGPTVSVSAGEVTITGFTLTGGNSVGFGGGLSVTGTEPVTVDSCVVTGNVSSDGAGIYSYIGAQLVLVQTTISDNTGGIGGGLAMNGNGLTGSLSMTSCTISDNIADEAGSGMVLFDVPVVQITSSSIVDNASLDGGGLAVAGSMVTLTDTTVQRNDASGMGGGLTLYPGDGVVVVVDGDWGTGTDDNTPNDVAIVGVGTWSGYGAGVDFQCDAAGCS
jgi:Putative metal-binding motif